MIIAIIVYFITFYLLIRFKKVKLKNEPFPLLTLTKRGVSFFSNETHKLKIENYKVYLFNNTLYLKTNEKLIIFKNIKDVKIYNNYLYFTSNGKTQILFDCKQIYRYFAINVQSQQFNLNNLKQLAILDLLNNGFELKLSKITIKYVNIIENILNIHIFNSKIKIDANKFRFSFSVTYRLNNRIKKVNVNQIF